MRIATAHTVRVGKVDMDGNPLPALGFLNLRRDPFQLLDDKPVQQGRVFIEAAAILGEQVADDVAACLRIGWRANKGRPPLLVRSRRMVDGSRL